MNFWELNIQFQEEYKRLDSLCKDMLHSAEGVSDYLRQMESTFSYTRKLSPTWETDYKQLKHYRWVRNQLSHEVGTLNSEFCTQSDIEWITDFYQRILSTDDPLAVTRRIREEETSRRQVFAKSHSVKSETHNEGYSEKETKKVSAWSRFIRKLKEFFCC